MHKTKLKRMVILTQYRLLYNQNKDIEQSILSGSGIVLKQIYNLYIKNQKISQKPYFKALIESFKFRKLPLTDQKFVLFSQIDKYLLNSYNNYKPAKKFQELIDAIDVYLSHSKVADLSVHLRKLVQENYKISPKTPYIKKKQGLLINTQNKINELKELMHWISHISHLSDLMRDKGRNLLEKRRMKKAGDYYDDGYYLDNINNFYDHFLQENSYANKIFKELGGDPLNIKNSELKYKIEALIEQNYHDVYKIKYGYNQSDKNDAKNLYHQNALPAVVSGDLQQDLSTMINNSVVLHTKRDLFKAMKNRLFKHHQITIHDEGKNDALYSNKYFVIYTYEMNVDQLRSLEKLAKITLNKIDTINAQKIVKDRENLMNYHKCTYFINYNDQDGKTRKFNRFCKYLCAEKLAKRHIFVDKRDQIRFKGGNIERKHNPTGLCTELQKIFIFSFFHLGHCN
jgi:hypothetical protein